jgi:PKD domain
VRRRWLLAQHKVRELSQRWLLLLLALTFAIGALPVSACGIDGIPSMAMNGRLVSINQSQATKDNLSYYAPFLLGTAKPGVELRFGEDAAKLHKALTEQAFATPFQWSFGDGGSAHGLSVRHQYAQPGWYKVNVSYYYTPQRRWVVFDSAQLRIPGTARTTQAGTSSSPLVWIVAGTLLGFAAIATAIWSLRRRAARRGSSGHPRASRGSTDGSRRAVRTRGG